MFPFENNTNKEGETRMKGQKKKQAGITLIALVISIIVMLILARSKFECNSWG